MGVIVSKNNNGGTDELAYTANKTGVGAFGKKLFRNLAAPASPVVVVRQGDGIGKVVPSIICPMGDVDDGGNNLETTTVRTKSTASIDSDEDQHWFNQAKREW